MQGLRRSSTARARGVPLSSTSSGSSRLNQVWPESTSLNKRSDIHVACIAKAQREALTNKSLALNLHAHGSALAGTHDLYAGIEQKRAAALAEVGEIELGAGCEVMPELADASRAHMRDTLRSPTALNVGASLEGLDLANDAGVFASATDAAESMQAGNSLERMLAHQMALTHKLVMTIGAQAATQQNTLEQARLVNSCTRLIRTYQSGMLAFQRIRGGGRQIVTVQHVTVSDGGRAVVAGAVRATGGQRRGRIEK